MSEDAERIRIDQWLWAARFFRTRTLAKAAVEGGKVHVDRERVKASREVRLNQIIAIVRGTGETEVVVTGLAKRRGSAKDAALLYTETPESIELRERHATQRRLERAGLTPPSGRPSKRDRRELAKLKAIDATLQDGSI